jgi:hypothetical protein
MPWEMQALAVRVKVGSETPGGSIVRWRVPVTVTWTRLPSTVMVASRAQL